MKLPTLYKRTSNGKIEQWSIWTERATVVTADDADPDYEIVTEYGHVGGKLQQARELVTEGKNLGKKNATTAQQQAESQAKSEWTTKVTRKGYVEDLSAAEAGENAGAGGIRPMLAKSFSKDGDKIVYPCFAQPKLDGIRCIAVVEDKDQDGKKHVTLWSREQKAITSVPHIARAVEELDLPTGMVLDGELYNHDLKNDFEKIVSAVRKQGPVDDASAKLIQYHIYDLPRNPGEVEGPALFRHRTKILSWRKAVLPLVLVETKEIASNEDLLEYFDDCRSRGYEGCMARNSGSPYEEGRRSAHLQKLKEFDEGEFPIVGVEEGVGKMAGLAIFVCKTESGEEFRCKMEGSLEALRKYLQDPSTWQGKKLTVKYQGLTGKARVPRFPVGKAVRDYE